MSRRVEHGECHAAHVEGRVQAGDVVLASEWHEQPRTRAIPEVHRHRPWRLEQRPSAGLTVRDIDAARPIEIQAHAAGGRRDLVSVAEPADDLRRAILKRRGHLGQDHMADKLHALEEHDDTDQGERDPREIRDDDARGNALRLSCGRHHLRRRRLARGQRGRERIAAGQRRGDRERRRRPLRRIALQAAEDHALDRRIEIADDRRRRRDRRLLALGDQLGQVRARRARAGR